MGESNTTQQIIEAKKGAFGTEKAVLSGILNLMMSYSCSTLGQLVEVGQVNDIGTMTEKRAIAVAQLILSLGIDV